MLDVFLLEFASVFDQMVVQARIHVCERAFTFLSMNLFCAKKNYIPNWNELKGLRVGRAKERTRKNIVPKVCIKLNPETIGNDGTKMRYSFEFMLFVFSPAMSADVRF